MIIPIRCFSCGTVVAHKWDEFNNKIAEGTNVDQALDDVGLGDTVVDACTLDTSI